MYGSLGGKGGGSISSSSRVEGNRVLADEVVLRLLLLREDCLGRGPSADIMVGVLERGDPVAYCDLKEAKEDVRERAIDESRRVRGDGESSSSLRVVVSVEGIENQTQNACAYLSLHPNPVVRPMPPRKSLPSLCLVRRLRVSRSSLNRPVFVLVDTKPPKSELPTRRKYEGLTSRHGASRSTRRAESSDHFRTG